jgi:hypothetical protein
MTTNDNIHGKLKNYKCIKFILALPQRVFSQTTSHDKPLSHCPSRLLRVAIGCSQELGFL